MRPALAIALVAIAGCVTVTLLPATPDQLARAQARWPEVSSASLEQGRTLYGDRCSGCHSLPDPREYRVDTWPAQVERMVPAAHLSAEQTALITRYLQAIAPQ